jgi:cytochrome c
MEACMIKPSICACAIAFLASPAAAGPLHDAVKTGDIAQVKLLIAQGEDLNKRQFPGGAPLHYAAIWGNAEMAELLLAEGAEVNLDDRSLGTPLKMAAFKGNEAVAVVLIANGAEILATSGNGTTPLHAAAEGGHASIVELLIESGADVNARSAPKSGTPDYAPVHSAGQFFHFDIVDLLRAYGARGPTVKPVTDFLTSADPSSGEEVFNGACRGCHNIEQGLPARAGPNLWGVLGRKKSSFENFKYSQAFGRLVGTWTLAEFNAFVAAPMDYVPGTTMHAEGVEDPTQRANLIAFLRQNSDDPPPIPPRP